MQLCAPEVIGLYLWSLLLIEKEMTLSFPPGSAWRSPLTESEKSGSGGDELRFSFISRSWDSAHLASSFWLQVSVCYMENSLGLCSHTDLVWHKWFIFLVFLRSLFCWKASEDWSTKGQGILKQWHLLVDWDCHTLWLSTPENWLRFSSLKLKFIHSLDIYYMKRPIYFAL